MVEREQLHPSDYLRVLRRSRLLIALIAIGVAVVAVAIGLAGPHVYEATAEVVVQQASTNSVFGTNNSPTPDPARALETQIRVIEGPQVRTAAEKKVGRAPKISAAAAKDADVIGITAQEPSAQKAAAVANAYAEAFVDLLRQQAVDEVLALTKSIQTKITDLQGQIDGATGVERDTLVQAQGAFRQKLGELQVNEPLSGSSARLVTPAVAPAAPAKPRPFRTGLWALSFGLVLGVGAAFARDYLDNSVKTKEDLERAAPGLPVLGLIPTVPGWKSDEDGGGRGTGSIRADAPEAFRTLRTTVKFLGIESPAQVLQITSPGVRDGKTTMVAHLAGAIARTGQRVIVVDCDLRRPRMHQVYGQENRAGLTSVVIGRVPLSNAMAPVADVPNLLLLPSGPRPPNPSELLSSKRTAEIIDALRQAADVVLLDCPPVLPVTDALVSAAHADATLLVCRAGVTDRRNLMRALELLRQVNAPVAGTILNGASAHDTYGDSYGEYYHLPEATGDRAPAVAKRPAPR